MMKNKSKKILLALLLTCSVAMLASGCDKLKKEPQTETEEPTEAPTEAPTETEPQTEPPTETEPQTETEPPTEAQTQPKELTVEEELAQETELDAIRTVYATDNINVRVKPGKGDDVEIFDSFDQGEQIRVIGETPNWYVVDLDDYEDNGYVAKEVVSDQEVAPKTEEELAQLADGGAGETAADTSGAAEASAAAGSESSDADAQYGVETYAESFSIQAKTGANMRQTPAQDGEIINTIASGTNVTAIGYTDRWYKIEYDGVVGYVNKNLFATE